MRMGRLYIVGMIYVVILNMSGTVAAAPESINEAVTVKRDAGSFITQRTFFSIGPTFSFLFERTGRGYAYGLTLSSGTFAGKTNFFYGFANHFGEFPSRRTGYFEFAPFVGYRFDGLRHVAVDIQLEMNMGSQYESGNRLERKLRGSRRVLVGALPGVSPVLLVSFPSTYDYDMSIAFIPVIKFGSMRTFRRSYGILAVTFNIKKRWLIQKQHWNEGKKERTI